MITKTVTIQLEKGLEARPVAVLVQKATMFDSTIYIHVGDKKVNAKSIMGLMSISLANGQEVTVAADGTDEAAAIACIGNYLSCRTSEESD